MNRRRFIDWCIGCGLCAGGVGMAAPAAMFLWPARKGGPGATDLPVGRAEEWPVGGGRVVQLHARPVLVIRREADEFRAFSAICTHLGCLVKWNEQIARIECPCHAAAFDDAGRVISGPPPAPLPPIDVSVKDGEVWLRG